MDFYSQDNINNIQMMIKAAVNAQLQVDIPPQNQNELLIIMRAVKIGNQYTMNATTSMLNDQVVGRALAIIKPKLELARSDRTQLMWESPKPMALPVNMSIKGTRVGQYNVGP